MGNESGETVRRAVERVVYSFGRCRRYRMFIENRTQTCADAVGIERYHELRCLVGAMPYGIGHLFSIICYKYLIPRGSFFDKCPFAFLLPHFCNFY
jgi:hypothetical protein